MADDQKSFWTSVPGILTGLAAVITAAGGLIAAFHSHSSSQAANAPTAVTQPASTAAATGTTSSSGASSSVGSAMSYTGFWSGSAQTLRMAVLNLEGSGTTVSGGTFQRPCVGDRLFPVSSVVGHGDSLTVTISDLGKVGKNKQPAPPIEFDLKAQDGKLTGTYIQGRHHEPIAFSPGKEGCPAGAKETDAGN